MGRGDGRTRGHRQAYNPGLLGRRKAVWILHPLSRRIHLLDGSYRGHPEPQHYRRRANYVCGADELFKRSTRRNSCAHAQQQQPKGPWNGLEAVCRPFAVFGCSHRTPHAVDTGISAWTCTPCRVGCNCQRFARIFGTGT